MPGRFFLQRFLKRLVDNKCDFGVIEVTSEGIKQKRNLFIDFDISLITNLKPEHIESHGGFENYKLAKSALFTNLDKSYSKNIAKTIIVNNDDNEARSFLQFNAKQKITFGIHAPSDVRGKLIDTTLFQNDFKVQIGDQSVIIKIPAGGPFITENALAAIAVGKALKIDLPICVNALEKVTNPPGRFEIVSKKPLVIVDYAHTIAAVEKILSFVKENWSGKIIHVFGAAGGGRDKWKRPQLAELSERFTDQTILTEENSFDEPVENILKNIYSGFKDKSRVLTIPDRTLAVKKALEIASDSDDTMVLLTAKGSETVIAGPLGRKTPYNEKQTVLCLLNK
jgi:UDP-N-acetylmuramoyl-L-alanyl-D-glutamate--2,6-diaminopimelate ligase